jgi:hypothetical protein
MIQTISGWTYLLQFMQTLIDPFREGRVGPDVLDRLAFTEGYAVRSDDVLGVRRAIDGFAYTNVCPSVHVG